MNQILHIRIYEESTHMKLLPPIFHLVLLLLNITYSKYYFD